jgi:hypothetical protein
MMLAWSTLEKDNQETKKKEEHKREKRTQKKEKNKSRIF